MLDESKNNYYACVYASEDRYGAAFCDISTGSFSATYFEGCDAQEAVCNELGSFSPTELLLGGNEENIREIRSVATDRLGCCMGRSREHQFDLSLCKAAVESQFEKTQEALGLSGHDEVVIAAGALLCALRDAQKNELPHIRALDFLRRGQVHGTGPDCPAQPRADRDDALEGEKRESARRSRPDENCHGRAAASLVDGETSSQPPRKSGGGLPPRRSWSTKRSTARSCGFLCARCRTTSASWRASSPARQTAGIWSVWRRARRRFRRFTTGCIR